MLGLFAALLLGQPQPMPTPASEWLTAYNDARTLPAHVAKYTRYFTFANSTIVDVKEIKDAAAVLTFHLWSLAHEPEPPQLRWVSPTVAAINLEEFGIDWPTYGRLRTRDVYHHVSITQDGKKLTDFAAAFWLGDPKVVAGLIEITHSQSPLLRWDWFFVETSIQEGRGEPGKGTGYYDFLGVKNRDDFFKLAGTDVKLATERMRRWRAIVKESGVANFPRQIERLDGLGAGHWFTLDVLDDGKGPRNALRQFDKDFAHQAEEHYASGPAGLPIYLACDAQGKLQASAPDKVGPDKTRLGNRTTIDVCASCARCHIEILRPIDNWIATALKDPATAELSPEKALEARRLYFRNLNYKLEQDRRAFTDRLKECNGLEPKKNATLYAQFWDRYVEQRLTLADCARELGTTPDRLSGVLLAVQVQKKLDPVLADLVGKPAGKIRREHWEELYPIAQIYLGVRP